MFILRGLGCWWFGLLIVRGVCLVGLSESAGFYLVGSDLVKFSVKALVHTAYLCVGVNVLEHCFDVILEDSESFKKKVCSATASSRQK